MRTDFVYQIDGGKVKLGLEFSPKAIYIFSPLPTGHFDEGRSISAIQDILGKFRKAAIPCAEYTRRVETQRFVDCVIVPNHFKSIVAGLIPLSQ